MHGRNAAGDVGEEAERVLEGEVLGEVACETLHVTVGDEF